MSVRGLEQLRSLCKLLIQQNRDGSLKSGLELRSVAVRAANEILALTKLRSSRVWTNRDLDTLVASLRATARERRLDAMTRLRALKRLAFIELGEPTLGDEPTDELIRQLTSGSSLTLTSQHKPPEHETFEQRRARILAAHGH